MDHEHYSHHRSPRKGDRLRYYDGTTWRVTGLEGSICYIKDEESEVRTMFLWSFVDGFNNRFCLI